MSTILYKTIFLILSILPFINGMDIKLSLGKKLETSGYYPLIITLTEPWIYETNEIDLFCVFDVSGSMGRERMDNLKASLNLIIDALDSKDRLSLIQFSNSAQTISELAPMSDEEKAKDKEKVKNLRASGGTSFNSAIQEFIRGIEKTYSPENGRVQSIIFLSDGEGGNAKDLFIKNMQNKNKNYDFTVHTFGIGYDNVFENFCALSDYRDGSFYYIKNLERLKEYVLNIIGGLRTTAFKHVEIDIESYYPIVKVFESNRLNSNYTKNTKRFTINILQFVTGTEYTYVLELNITDNIKIGDNIIKAHATYQDFKGSTYKVDNFINFYYAIGCFNCYREEYCRISVIEELEKLYIKKRRRESIDSSTLDKIKSDCGSYLNKNISNALEEAKKGYNESYLLGIISEASFKKGGMNLWYSNEYQYELINDFLFQKDNRYFWERFHVPYWKLNFLRRIHRAVAVPLQFIYIIFVITITIPLSFISVFVFRGIGRLIFNMIAGLIIQIALFDVAFLNVFISCCIVYLLLRCTKIRGGPILFSLFGYLIGVHIFHFIFYGQTLDFGASPFLFMFAIAKITFFTYAVRERKVSPIHFINQYHRYCITDEKFPNFLEFLSYIYFFPSAIYGPCFQIKDYLNYIYKREEYQRIKYGKELIQATIRIIVGYGLICLYYFFKYNSFLQLGIFKTYEYIASDDALSIHVALRFLMIYGWCLFIKFFIYGFFQLIYGIFMTTGIAYSEEVVLSNLKGGDDYVLDVSDKKGHCGRILKSDLGYNIGETINHFNRSIHIYLKYCVYIRIIFLRNSWIKNYFIAAIFVFIFAALYCGIYVGAYFFFAAACVIYQCHFNLELIGFYDWLDKANIVIKIIMTILVQYIMSMVFCMLFLYKLDMILCYLRNYYFTPVAIVTVLYIVSLILRICAFKIKIPEKPAKGRSKIKTQINKKEEALLKS